MHCNSLYDATPLAGGGVTTSQSSQSLLTNSQFKVWWTRWNKIVQYNLTQWDGLWENRSKCTHVFWCSKKTLHNSNEQCFCCTSCADTKLAPDTNLSKIRTLRLAIRYIKFLMEILEERDQETISNSFETNICETLHLPRHHLHNIWSFLYFDRKRIQNQSRQKTEQDGPSISGKAN